MAKSISVISLNWKNWHVKIPCTEKNDFFSSIMSIIVGIMIIMLTIFLNILNLTLFTVYHVLSENIQLCFVVISKNIHKKTLTLPFKRFLVFFFLTYKWRKDLTSNQFVVRWDWWDETVTPHTLTISWNIKIMLTQPVQSAMQVCVEFDDYLEVQLVPELVLVLVQTLVQGQHPCWGAASFEGLHWHAFQADHIPNYKKQTSK